MRKGAERTGCGQRPPGEKLGGDFGGIRGGWGGRVMGGYVRRRNNPSVMAGTVYDVGCFLLCRLAVPFLFAWRLSLFMR